MSVKKIAVIGGDRRFYYLAEALKKDGYSVSVFGNEGGESNVESALEGAYAAVLPFPISPDGVYLNAREPNIRLSSLFEKLREYGVKRVFGGAVSETVLKLAEINDIFVCDYGKKETVLLKNALCTAEGALQIALENLPVTVHSAKVTVLGYGRIGKILCSELSSLGAYVRGVARKSADIARMQIDGVSPYRFTEIMQALDGVELVFNTVPAPVMSGEILSSLKEKPLIIDLASAPGGVDRNTARELGINVIWALSLPGKTAPMTAAEIIKEAVVSALYETTFPLFN
jgi:dipicolinate synthase subunit A